MGGDRLMALKQEAVDLMRTVNKELKMDALQVASDLHIASRFPSGSLTLDLALGGGWPGNQWVEIYGKESNGKTFVTLKTIAANQARDPEFTTFWLAGEHYDVDQAEALGVDNSRVIVHPTQSMEEAYDMMLRFSASLAIDCVVLDSYPALSPDEEAAKDMDESTMALGARLTGKFFRKVGPSMLRGEDDCPLLGIYINQQRDAIGQFSPHGTPQTTPGGKAKNYAFYVRVDVRRDDWITESVPGQGKVKVGQTIKISTVKNKSAPPQQVAFVDAYFRDTETLGFKRGDYDTVKEQVLLGLLYDVIVRKGAWFEYGGQRWQGKDAMVAGIREDVDLSESLTQAITEFALDPSNDVTFSDEDVEAAANAGERKVQRRGSEEAAA